MYLLLRADQRLKQNREGVLLLAHLQELYLSVKDLGLIEPENFSSIAYPGVKTAEFSSSWPITSRRRWSD